MHWKYKLYRTIIENMVFLQLIRRKSLNPSIEIYYWKDSWDLEDKHAMDGKMKFVPLRKWLLDTPVALNNQRPG